MQIRDVTARRFSVTIEGGKPHMHKLILTGNFEVVIPEELCVKLGLKPGEELNIYERDGEIRISNHRPITELRGMCKGMKWDDYRDRNDRY